MKLSCLRLESMLFELHKGIIEHRKMASPLEAAVQSNSFMARNVLGMSCPLLTTHSKNVLSIS